MIGTKIRNLKFETIDDQIHASWEQCFYLFWIEVGRWSQRSARSKHGAQWFDEDTEQDIGVSMSLWLLSEWQAYKIFNKV